jgi:hypothetical protein
MVGEPIFQKKKLALSGDSVDVMQPSENLCEYRRPRLLLKAYCLPSRMGTGAEHQHVPPEQPPANDTPRQQQNTATRKLTMEMLDSVFRRAREILGLRPSYARAK